MSRHKKKCLTVFLILIMVLSGCNLGTSDKKGKESNPSLSAITESMANGWRDNSLDAYSARFIADVTPKELEDGFAYGGWNEVMSDARTYVLQKHICTEDYSKSWDELIIADHAGNVSRQRLALPFTPDAVNQIIRMGRVWGNDHIVCVNVEEGEDGASWRVFELDENLETQWFFVAEFLEGGTDLFPECVMRDLDGNVHLAFRSFSGESPLTHYVVNPEGEVLGAFALEETEGDANTTYGWMFSTGGNMLIKRRMTGIPNSSEQLIRVETDTGLGMKVFERRLDSSKPDMMKYVLLDEEFSQSDERNVLYADDSGVYLCDANFENPECLYLWSNHGISVFEIEDVRRYGDGTIGVFFMEDGGDRFAILEPTTEQVEPIRITVAVPDFRVIYYSAIVNEFNRKHPAWHVEIKTDYEETRLLAELGSGNGPVLVDTSFISFGRGFEKLVKLWEPLDELLTQANLNDVLLESVMEGCRIDGVTYGIPLDSTVFTVITHAGMNLEDWNYEYFLSLAEDPGVKAVYPPEPYSDDDADNAVGLTYNLMMHGLEDNYLINASDPSNCVDGERLNRVLNLAEGKCLGLDKNYDWAEAFKRGEVLCHVDALRNCIFVTNLKNRYGSDVVFIGFPTNEGGKSLASAVIPLCVRITATDEEREVAHAFLLEALSYEGQMLEIETNYNFGISVRRDILEYQIKTNIDDYLDLARKEGLGLPRKPLEEDAEIFRRLVNEMVPKRDLPFELKDILDQEFDEYWQGNINRKQLLDHLQNRVRLYLRE